MMKFMSKQSSKKIQNKSQIKKKMNKCNCKKLQNNHFNQHLKIKICQQIHKFKIFMIINLHLLIWAQEFNQMNNK